jgi:hypothetical protein
VFHLIVFWLLALLLFLASSAALYMGLFKAHRQGRTQGFKALGGLVSGGVSGVFWFYAYGFTYLGW